MRWDPGERYATSKLLQHLVLPKLTAYVNPDDVIVNLVDPGFCKGSGLHRDAHGMIKAILSLMKTITGRTLETGSSTYVDASVIKGKESHGCFVMDWSIKPFANMVYDPKGVPVINRLWDETMTELDFAGARDVLKNL
ncbi:putative short-chain dehydrogenase reductase family protein [Phaeoacremonium minimum UCRPA7]|uniref:Putative short-chain dehydrogenase reductase family protein n=1 Tax=Phaeoacremonium minimum (strain UCR-PA7) TaxID=1286976 RepID=R8BLN1_PHAM7|nr:putative short-chain dehydrogenase reductase family protein [Phaeoacremonium minimum UCRPA7]EOO00286.1 putative short-chain dehydrogenase reductase family protein [Phaeoacremonium minimum UCRPA7]